MKSVNGGLIVIFTIISLTSLKGQVTGDTVLLNKLVSIRGEKHFRGDLITHEALNSNNSALFQRWDADVVYYQYDMVRVVGVYYECLSDSVVGMYPPQSPHQWRSDNNDHPYLYLQDSARTEDLVELLSDTHPFVRLYSFGSLVNRYHPEIYSILLTHLSDSTSVLVTAGDTMGEEAVPSVMIWLAWTMLSSSQQETLRQLVKSKYHHIKLSGDTY